MPNTARFSYFASSILCSVLLAVLSACGNARIYSEQARAATAEAEGVLVRNNICANHRECQVGGFVFYEEVGGVYVNVYSVSDMNVAQQISSVLCRLYLKDTSVPYRLTVYSTTHSSNAKRVLFRGDYGSKLTCQ